MCFLCRLSSSLHFFSSSGHPISSKILYKPEYSKSEDIYNSSSQEHDLEKVLDKEVIKEVEPVLNKKLSTINVKKQIKTCRTYVGKM